MIHVGADGECLYVDLYMNYNEVHNHLHVDRFRFRASNTPFSTRPNANMAAQLGQDTLAKDREDGTRIGAAASENQPLQQAGLPAEDLSARVLAADRRQDAMALQLEGLAAQMTAMTQAISAMAGIAVKDEKRPAMGAPNASDTFPMPQLWS